MTAEVRTSAPGFVRANIYLEPIFCSTIQNILDEGDLTSRELIPDVLDDGGD